MANLKLVKSATALVLGASVLTSAVAVSGTDASAKTTYKVTKAGTLVNAKTNKAVKGYKSYKGKLYKNGKKLTGTYKSVFYKSGVKFTGTYNKKYYVKGKLFTGKTSKNVYYKKGVKFTGVTSYGYTYKDGKRVEGEYKGKVYKNGKLLTGLYKDVLYKKGVKETGLDLYKDKLYNEGVLNVGLALFQEKLYNNADLATGIFTYNGVEDQYKDGVVVPTKVESASAVNSTTVEVKGTNLTKLAATDYAVSNNTVKSVKVSDDRTTATLVLGTQLYEGEEATLTTGETKLAFSYKLDFSTISVSEATYDDDTKNQAIKFKTDNNEVTAADLVAAGYTLTFSAYKDAKGVTAEKIFGGTVYGTGDSATSATGVLTANLQGLAGGATLPSEGVPIYVTVKAVKGEKVVTSELQKITIKNTDLITNEITDYTLTGDNGLEQNSNNLVVGETATLDDITTTDDGTKTTIDYATHPTAYSVKSSNEAVVSVSGNSLVAKTPGTATVTVTYGNVTKTINVTVSKEAREVSKLVVVNDQDQAIASKSYVLTTGATPSVTVKALDQYGDLVTGITAGDLKAVTSDATVLGLDSSAGAGKLDELVEESAPDLGYYSIDLSKEKVGTAVVSFTYKGYKIPSNTYKVTITNNADVTANKLDLLYDKVAHPTWSDDSTLNLADSEDRQIVYDLNGYNKDGVDIADVTIKSVKVDQAADYVAAVKDGSKSNRLNITPGTSGKSGTATVTVTYEDAAGADKTISVTIKVIDDQATVRNLKAVSFNGLVAPTATSVYSIYNALSLTKTNNDSIVSGLTLTKSTTAKLRVDETNYASSVTTAGINSVSVPANALAIYIDSNANGVLDSSDETVVGYVTMEYVTTDSADALTAQAEGSFDITDETTGTVKFEYGKTYNGTVIYRAYDKDGKFVNSTSLKVQQ